MTPTNTFGQPITQAGGSVVPNTYTPPTSITSDHLAPQSPTQLPPPPTPTNPIPTNLSVPSPIPTAASIVGQEGQTSQTEGQQKSILDRIASLTGGNTSLATLQTTQESNSGVPGLTKTVNDLSTQLQGLNDQASSLAIAGGAGGTIQNQDTNNAIGRMSTTGLQGQTAVDLRNNQIQQATIASQALTVKSALYGAQGNLSLAKDAADKAAQVQYDATQQQIAYQKSQLDAIAPTLTKEQQAKADLVKAQLQDRQNALDQAKTDMTTGIAMATAAIKNNPNDPKAQYAAQQALQAAQQQPPDLQKIFSLVGKYQTDPVATAKAQQDLVNSRLTGQKTAQEIAANAPLSPNDPSAKAALDSGSQSILAQTGLSVAAFNYLTQGTAALSRLSSTDRQKIMNEAGTFLNKNGLDYSTFQSQYKAQNDVVQQNISRAANTKIFGGEVSGTVSQFIQDVGTDIPNLKPAAVAELFAKGQTNDSTAQKYAFDLQTMQNDLAGYYAASRGSSSPDQSDLSAAANVITNGLSGKGATAFKQSIDTNIQKVGSVVNDAVTNAQKAVWDQFGVGDKYKSKASVSNADAVKAAAPAGQIAITRNGVPGFIPEGEFDPKTDKKL